MGLTTSVLSGTWVGSSEQQNAGSPSLTSSWEFLTHELVPAVPELMHSSSTPSILYQALCNCAQVRRIISFSFLKAFYVYLLHDPLHFIDDIHTSISVPGWLLFFSCVPGDMGKWLLFPSGWTRWTLVFCSPLPRPARKIPSVLKFHQWMCFCEGWSGQMWKKVLCAAKTQLCGFSPKISLL